MKSTCELLIRIVIYHLFAPAYLKISEDLNILGLGGLAVAILFGNDLLWNHLPFKRIREVCMPRIQKMF